MRVLLVLEACGGGSGRHVVDLARGLLARGHEVTLVYSPLRADAGFSRDIAALDGLRCGELPIRRAVSFSDIGAGRQLRRLIEREGPFDVMHAHSSKAGGLLRLAQAGRNAPVVYTPHAPITMDPALSFPARLIYGTAERLLAKLCRRIICVSPAERDHLVECGFPAGQLSVVCNGFDLDETFDRDAVRATFGLDENAICFGFVGRLSHQKAVDRLLRAFAVVAGQNPDARLVIVGDGPDLDALRALARELDIAPRAVFPGALPGLEAMAAFDVFVLPSRYEGMPYVLLEAAATGLPIVMADVGGRISSSAKGETDSSLRVSMRMNWASDCCRWPCRRNCAGKWPANRRPLQRNSPSTRWSRRRYRSIRKFRKISNCSRRAARRTTSGK